MSWSEGEEAIIREGILQGLTWETIADDLPGRTSRTARLRADRLGIRPVRKATDAKCPIAGSHTLAESMDEAVGRFAARHKIGFQEARTLLMDCADLAPGVI